MFDYPRRWFMDALFGTDLSWLGTAAAPARQHVLKAIDQLQAKIKPGNKPVGDSSVAPRHEPVLSGQHSLHLQMTMGQAGRNLGAGGIALVLLTEDHDHGEDKKRGRSVIAEVHSMFALEPTAIVLERKIGYYVPKGFTGITIDEDDLTTSGGMKYGHGMGLHVRSVVIAGYVFLCLAVGDQKSQEKILIFFGENHKDILEHFEYFVQNSAADWVKLRPRSYTFIPSSKPVASKKA